MHYNRLTAADQNPHSTKYIALITQIMYERNQCNTLIHIRHSLANGDFTITHVKLHYEGRSVYLTTVEEL